MKIRVLIATGLYPPDIGGPATYTRMLEAVLPEKGFALQVIPFGGVRQYPKLVRHVVYAWRLWRHAKRADIIYALDPISVGLPAWFVSFLTRRPFLVRLGGDYAWEQGQQRFGVSSTLDEYTENHQAAPWPVRLLARLQTFVVSRAEKVIAPSEYLRSIILSWGADPDKVVTIYSVLHPINVTESKATLREQLEYTQPTIVTAGRLVPWKGMDCLLRVLKRMKADYPDISLIIIGDGPEEKKLKALANELGLSDSVRFTGRLGKDALGAAVKAGDVFVLNTAYEGMSHQLLEVMDLGVPVVTTKVGGNPELIKDEVSGLLTAFDDEVAIESAIKRLLNKETLRDNLTKQARVRTRDFDQAIVTDKIAQTLSELVHE